MFDQERLTRDVELGVVKRISAATIDRAIEDVVATVSRRARAEGEALTDDEQADCPDAQTWIRDDLIAVTVENVLERSNRMALVLYALSTRGRRDVEREGWKTAADVLSWIGARYPDLSNDPPERVRPQLERWARPLADAPRPQQVIKRSDSAGVRGGLRPFHYPQFVRSINLALAGRPNRPVNAPLIAEWVLWGLAGQKVVLSSQLSVVVLECLRRLDDIAYLRWAVIAKRIESVTEFSQEALALLAHPSPRLRFSDEVVAGRGPATEARGGLASAIQPAADQTHEVTETE